MMYRDKMQWEDALRVAEYFLPSKVPDIHCDLAEYMQRYELIINCFYVGFGLERIAAI